MGTVDLTDHLKGFAPSRHNKWSEGHLIFAGGCEAGPNGMVPPRTIYTPAGIGTVAHPFPQLFIGDEDKLICHETAINYATAANFGSSSAYTLYDVSDLSAGYVLGTPTGSITAGGDIWQCADFGNSWFLFNGSAQVFKWYGFGVFVDETAFANTGCAFGGRLVMGGLGSYLSTAYKAKVLSFRTKSTGDALTAGDNWIWWTSPTREDAFWPHFPWMVTKDNFTRLVDRGEFGFAVMPFNGKVQVVKPLGDGVMVYGLYDSAFVRWNENGIPAIQKVPGVGACGRGGAGGNEQVHLCVDGEGYVWRITPGPKVEFLDYYNYVSDAGEIIVHFDPLDSSFFLCSRATDMYSLMLTPHGMTYAYNRPSGIVRQAGVLYGGVSYPDYDNFKIETGWFTIDNTLRTLTGLYVDCNSWDYLRAAVYARRTEDDTPNHTGGDILDGGRAFFESTGVQFKVVVEWTNTDRHTSEVRKLSVDYLDGPRRLDFGGLI